MSKIIKTKERGNLIVISGPSGAGKGTIVDGLKNVNENIWVSISMTSREPRKNDIPDETYFFVSREEFEERISRGEFLEYAIYNENYYGTPRDKIAHKLEQGYDVVLEIEIQGALKVKELVDEVDINRSTFYLHYETKDDLLKETIKFINNKFYAGIDPFLGVLIFWSTLFYISEVI